MPPRNKTALKADTRSKVSVDAKLWLVADIVHNNTDAAEYKHVVLGLSEASPLGMPCFFRSGRVFGNFGMD